MLRKLTCFCLSFALGASALSAAPAVPAVVAAPAVVQAPPKPVVHPSEAEAIRFVHAFSPSELRREGEIRTVRNDFVKTLRTDPTIGDMLDAFPKLGPELTAAMVAQIDLYIAGYDAQFFPRATEIVRAGLSREDVKILTAFYESPLGQKVLRSATQSVDASEVAQLGLKGEAVDAGVLNRQAMRSGIAAAQDLTQAERKQVADLGMSPTGRRFRSLRPQIIALQVELMNHPSEEFKRATQTALAEVMQRVTSVEATKAK
jgi:hypothetical protein